MGCACDPSVRLDAPSICLVCFSMSEVISSFKSLRSQVFTLLIVFLCVNLHTIWPGKSLHHTCVMHLTLWYVVLVCHQYDVCKNYAGSVYVGGILVSAKADSVSSVNCVQSAFL